LLFALPPSGSPASAFFGQGMVTLGSRSMLSKWWNLRRGRMVAISGCFIAFGFSLAPRVFDWQIQAFGWRGSLLLNASILSIGLSLFAWLVFRDNPEECGLEMDNGWKPDKRSDNPDTLLLKEFTRPEAMKTYSFWIITLSLSFHGLFTTAYTFHVIDLGRSFNVPRETILNFFIYSSFLSVTMNFLIGYITDRTRLRFVITFFCIGGFTFCMGLLMLPSTTGMVVLVAGMGCSWGTFPGSQHSRLCALLWPGPHRGNQRSIHGVAGLGKCRRSAVFQPEQGLFARLPGSSLWQHGDLPPSRPRKYFCTKPKQASTSLTRGQAPLQSASHDNAAGKEFRGLQESRSQSDGAPCRNGVCEPEEGRYRAGPHHGCLRTAQGIASPRPPSARLSKAILRPSSLSTINKPILPPEN
jgi:hypothetical protein